MCAIATYVMVCVFPQPVAPYAKTVALYPSSTLSKSGFVVASYTSPCVVVSSNTRSNANVWSFARFPWGPTVDRENRVTAWSSGGSKILCCVSCRHTGCHKWGGPHRHFSSKTLMTGRMPLEFNLGVGIPASEPSPRNSVWSSVLVNCAASRIVNGRTRTVTEIDDAPLAAMVTGENSWESEQ